VKRVGGRAARAVVAASVLWGVLVQGNVAAAADPIPLGDAEVSTGRSIEASAGSDPMSEAEASAGEGSDATTNEARAALAEAKSGGEPVEVKGLRTEYTTTYANPDGVTFTLKDSAVPVRVKGADGPWGVPDPTLEVRPDGTVGPRAAAVNLSFSGGGDGTGLVQIERDGRLLAWAGPETCPSLNLTVPRPCTARCSKASTYG
jgi:hypothetical protein